MTTKSATIPWRSNACAQNLSPAKLHSALAQNSCVSSWPPRMSVTRLFTKRWSCASRLADVGLQLRRKNDAL
eukprot:8093132-Prorocentrum_lima.AAC.1